MSKDKANKKTLVLEIEEVDGKINTNFISHGLNRPEIHGLIAMAEAFYRTSFIQQIIDSKREATQAKDSLVLPGGLQ